METLSLPHCKRFLFLHIYVNIVIERRQCYHQYCYQKDSEIQLYSDIVTKDYILSKMTMKNGWIGRVYNNWSSTTQYTIRQGFTFSATLNSSYSDVSFSVTASYTYGAAKTIAADSSRLSDLAMWQTYTVEKHRSDIYTGYGTVFQQSVYFSVVTKSGIPIVNPCYISGKYQCGLSYNY